MELQEGVQVRANKMAKGLENLSYEERQTDWNCSVWRRRGSVGIISMYTNTRNEGAKRTGSGSFQWFPVPEEEQWTQTETQKSPLNKRKGDCAGT